MRYALLNPILEELVKEGRIKIAIGKQGDIISWLPTSCSRNFAESPHKLQHRDNENVECGDESNV